MEKLVNDYSGLKEKDYTAESWKGFAEAMTNAKSVLEDKNASQETVNQTAEALKAAYEGLVKAEAPQPEKTDKSKLDKFYNECLDYYKEANHSKENWKAYQEALAEAKAVLENENASQKEIDNALDKLINITAKMNAELKDKADAPKNPVTNKPNVVKTGDTSSLIGWTVSGVLAVLAAVAAIFVRKRRQY